jgi:hypothetical protein
MNSKKIFKLNLEDKKAVSLFISYVILIVIAISMSIAVFVWLKVIANPEPVKTCDFGTSIAVYDYSCEVGKLTLTIKNNGRFNVDGFILRVGDNPEREPITALLPYAISDRSPEKYYLFTPPLNPGEEREASFSDDTEINGVTTQIDFDEIVNIKLYPYIFDDTIEGIKFSKTFCTEGIIKQSLESCTV